MDTKSMVCNNNWLIQAPSRLAKVLYIKHKKGGNFMVKFLTKIAEKYARNTNTTCIFYGLFHQPKMPASLIKKD